MKLLDVFNAFAHNMEALVYHIYTEWKFTEAGYSAFKIHDQDMLHQGDIMIVKMNASLWCTFFATSTSILVPWENMCLIYVLNNNKISRYYAMIISHLNNVYFTPTENNEIFTLKRSLAECQGLCEDLRALISSFKELESDINVTIGVIRD